MKNVRIFYLKIFLFLVVKFSIYLNRRDFEMLTIVNSFLLNIDEHENVCY